MLREQISESSEQNNTNMQPRTPSTPSTWVQPHQNHNGTELDKKASKGAIIVGMFACALIAGLLVQANSKIGKQQIQANIELSSIGKSAETQNNTTGIEISNAQWKSKMPLSEQIITQVGADEKFQPENYIIPTQAWSPSGNVVVYGIKKQTAIGAPSIKPMVYSISSKQAIELPEISNNGRPQSAFIEWVNESEFILNDDHPSFWQIDSNGKPSEINSPIKNQTNDAFSSWAISGNGTAIATVSEDGKIKITTIKSATDQFIGKRTIKITDKQTGKLLDKPQFVAPSWSPDGKKIAWYRLVPQELRSGKFAGTDQQEAEIVLLDVEKDALDAVKVLGKGFVINSLQYKPLWSADGSMVIDQNSGKVFKVDTNETIKDFGFTQKKADFIWSKDGKLLKITYGINTQISVVDVEKNKEKQIFAVSNGKNANSSTGDEQATVLTRWGSTDQIVISFDGRLLTIAPDATKAHKIETTSQTAGSMAIQATDSQVKVAIVAKNGIALIIF